MNKKKQKLIVITSWDNGHALDIKLAKMLFKYEIPGLFFLTNAAESAFVKTLYAMGFEIGGHTVDHYKLTGIEIDRAAHQIIANKHYLEEIIKKPIRYFCYPRGRYNQEIKKIVKYCGYIFARTTKVLAVQKSPDPWEMHTTVHCYNRDEYKGVSWENVALSEWAKIRSAGQGIYHLWGHSWEIEKWDYWDKLEMVLSKISQDIKILNSKLK